MKRNKYPSYYAGLSAVEVKDGQLISARLDAHNGTYENFPTKFRNKTKWHDLKSWTPEQELEDGFYAIHAVGYEAVKDFNDAKEFLDAYYYAGRSNHTKDEITEWNGY